MRRVLELIGGPNDGELREFDGDEKLPVGTFGSETVNRHGKKLIAVYWLEYHPDTGPCFRHQGYQIVGTEAA